MWLCVLICLCAGLPVCNGCGSTSVVVCMVIVLSLGRRQECCYWVWKLEYCSGSVVEFANGFSEVPVSKFCVDVLF